MSLQVKASSVSLSPQRISAIPNLCIQWNGSRIRCHEDATLSLLNAKILIGRSMLRHARKTDLTYRGWLPPSSPGVGFPGSQAVTNATAGGYLAVFISFSLRIIHAFRVPAAPEVRMQIYPALSPGRQCEPNFALSFWRPILDSCINCHHDSGSPSSVSVPYVQGSCAKGLFVWPIDCAPE